MPKKDLEPRKTSPEAVEGSIEAAIRRGDFAELPGAGKPLQGLNNDPLWWVKEKLRREQVSSLPPNLQLRLDRDRALEGARQTSSEMKARELLEEIDARIRKANATITAGPPSDVMPIDVDEAMDKWRRNEL